MKNVVVFCAANLGKGQVYYDNAYTLGRILANSGMTVVFGGGKVGLMGALADGALQHDGRVIGVIPTFLKTEEIAYIGVSELIEVQNMHERKMRMHELSDAIIALPGGWGTMEELFEMMTWAQLGLHAKPIGILNVNNYFNPFIAMMNNMVQEGFLRQELRDMLIVGDKVETLIADMQAYIAPQQPRIADEEEV